MFATQKNDLRPKKELGLQKPKLQNRAKSADAWHFPVLLISLIFYIMPNVSPNREHSTLQ